MITKGSKALTRRGFIGSAVAAVSLAEVSRARSAPSPGPMSPAELKRRIRGPILAIPTPFTSTFEVDYQAVRNMVRLGLANGITAYELTAGDSQYQVLSFEEIKELTRVLAEAVGDKGTFIAATGAWWTAPAVEYARYAESAGADGVQVLVPAGSEEGRLEHYRKIAEATRLGLVLHGNFPLSLLEKLLALPSVVAMKEDVSEKYYFDIQRKYGRRLAIFCGGQKWRFLIGQRYGSRGYLSTFATFAPQVAVRFWKAVERNDMDQAKEIVLRYDQPLFDFCLSGKRSFHAYWRGVLEYFGIAQRYLRPPSDVCTDADLREIKALFDSMGLEPKALPKAS
ncbi:MAG: dihydrodipicolinate synthase family protein [Acidobacteriota bacterium]